MRIVIVDDEVLVANSLASLLKSQGCEVISFVSGQEALKNIKNEGCDVVITDLNMSGMNGYELTLSIKSFLPKVPVILYSGNSKTASISRWRNSRFFAAILPKPTPFAKLIECINSVTEDVELGSTC